MVLKTTLEIIRGTLLRVPDGYHHLSAGVDYYFLYRCRTRDQVLLLTVDAARGVTHLIVMRQHNFDLGLCNQAIVAIEHRRIGPHLVGAEYVDPVQRDVRRTKAKKLHQDLIHERLQDIWFLVESEIEILEFENPEQEINRRIAARNASQRMAPDRKSLNLQRTRSRFFLYICFGHDSKNLLPDYWRKTGKWDRQSNPDGVKFGRPSLIHGRGYGRRIGLEEGERLANTYVRLAKAGRQGNAGTTLTLGDAYAQIMRNDYNARVWEDEHGNKQFHSSDGNPLPTFNQFVYQVKKSLGPNKHRLLVKGKEGYRSQDAAYKGTFASSVSNILQKVEADAWYAKERPRSYTRDSDILPPLVVARIADVATSQVVGVGFALGHETEKAYRAALFSMCLQKPLFGELFGLKIPREEWPTIGVPLHFVTDRGPGARGMSAHDQYDVDYESIPLRELTPSFSPQSKGTIEASHSRMRRLQGPVPQIVSNLLPHEMAQAEILKVVQDNQSSNVSRKLTPEMIRESVPPNPNGMYRYLNEHARNDGQILTLEAAAKAFLDPHEVTLRRDGVWLKHQRYDSAALRETGILGQVSHRGSITLTAYFIPFAIRTIWVEIDGRLIQVDSVLPIRDDTAQLYRTYEDLVYESSLVNQARSVQKENGMAVAAQRHERLEERLGRKPTTTYLSSRKKVSAAGREEMKLVREALDG